MTSPTKLSAIVRNVIFEKKEDPTGRCEIFTKSATIRVFQNGRFIDLNVTDEGYGPTFTGRDVVIGWDTVPSVVWPAWQHAQKLASRSLNVEYVGRADEQN